MISPFHTISTAKSCQLTNCLSLFDHIVELSLKGLDALLFRCLHRKASSGQFISVTGIFLQVSFFKITFPGYSRQVYAKSIENKTYNIFLKSRRQLQIYNWLGTYLASSLKFQLRRPFTAISYQQSEKCIQHEIIIFDINFEYSFSHETSCVYGLNRIR